MSVICQWIYGQLTPCPFTRTPSTTHWDLPLLTTRISCSVKFPVSSPLLIAPLDTVKSPEGAERQQTNQRGMMIDGYCYGH